MRYKIEKNGTDKSFAQKISRSFEAAEKKQLNNILSNEKFTEKFHVAKTTKELADIDPFKSDSPYQKEIDKDVSLLKENDTLWPGRYLFWRKNIRDLKSDPLGGDFFSYPELIGSITTTYKQVVDHILSELDEMGYDISHYKDKDGKLYINADRIEQLIIGEVVKNAAKDHSKQKKNTTEVSKKEEQVL
jgi:hypothetical protein